MQKLFGWSSAPGFGAPGIKACLEQITARNIPKFIAWLIIIGQSFGSIALMSGFLGRIAAGGLFIIFTGALIVHLPDGWTLNWFGSKKGEGIEYFVLLLSLLLVIVLKVLGETGTGKELIARAIHNRSKRSNRAFIRVNCAAIPSSLIASELFGHERGSFTGATQRRLGRFESADGGTIFLDEVGDLPPETQVALLRVLQEREFERVGGSQTVSVDVRVIAATNRDLTSAVAEGTFRQDLFYRLNAFPIQLPALRERISDSLLVEYLIDRYAQKAGKKIRNIDKKTMELFHAYDWPGNIRELQNVVERAVILSEGETFFVDEAWLTRVPPKSAMTSVLLVANLAEHEREMLEAALRESEGVVGGPTGAAVKLGIPRQTLESKIRKLGINRYRFKAS
jgi:formate hydrogenlyase transcriptional activator